MTNEEQIALVREKILQIVDSANFKQGLTSIEATDQILSIPELKILAPDQGLPKTPKQYRKGAHITDVYLEGWHNGFRWLRRKLKDNWIKVV